MNDLTLLSLPSLSPSSLSLSSSSSYSITPILYSSSRGSVSREGKGGVNWELCFARLSYLGTFIADDYIGAVECI